MLRWMCLAALLGAVPPASGQDTETKETGPVYHMTPVVIRAPRPVASVGGASAIEVRPDSLALPAAATTEEVLRALPLLHVRTNSRGEAEISARGSESRQVAVLVDGVPITLAWDARADVSVIPATALNDLVFVRGLSSMLYGPNVLGGIVEARVGRALPQPEARSTRLTMGADHVGSFGTTVTSDLPFANRAGAWLVRGGVGFRDTPGDPLARDVTEREGGDGLRLNTDAEHLDGFLALRYRAQGGTWLSFSGSSFRAERGIAAELGAPDEDARFWRYPHVSRTLAVVSGGTGDRGSPFGGRGDLEASVGFDAGRTEIDAFSSPAYDQLDSFEDGKDRTLTLRLLADQTLGARADLRGAFTGVEVRHDEIVPDGEFRYRQRLWSGGLENVWRLLESSGAVQSLGVSVGAAYDVAETREAGGKEPLDTTSQWGGRVGVSLLTGGGRTALHAGVSRRGRFPALRELYSGALNRFAPNPDLEPEKLVAVEGGVTTRIGNGELQAVAFHNRLSDAVVRITLPDRRFQRVNRNELRSAGVEVLGSYRLGVVDVSGHVTLQDVKLTDTEADETHRPENLPETSGALEARAPVAGGVFAGAGLAYTGRQFAIDLATGDDTELDAAAVAGAYVGRVWSVPVSLGGSTFSKAETRVAVDNLTDRAHYDQFGLPEPGRRFRFELRLR
jgi:iron complex outermembrane receptor protein